MIKQNKQGRWVVECAKCKTAAMDHQVTEAEALDNAERCHGYIVFGKFQFCAECLNDATERWKSNNRGLLEACKPVEHILVETRVLPPAQDVDIVVCAPPAPKKRGRPKKAQPPKPSGVSISANLP